MTQTRRGLLTGVLALVVLTSVLAGCQRARVGTRCAGSDFGFDSTHVLQCKKGRWVRVMTLARYAELVKEPSGGPMNGALKLSAGHGFSCALMRSRGTVKCWDVAHEGETGTGETVNQISPVTVPGVQGASQIFLGNGTHACVTVGELATVTCWGNNSDGQIGTGTTSPTSTAVQILLSSSTMRIGIGRAHTCSVISNGRVNCWGANESGELGLGKVSASEPTPTAVPGVTDAIDIAAGAGHTCIVRKGGTVQCWGANDAGQLGNGTTTDSSVPVDVIGVTGATAIVAGSVHTCAVVGNGAVKCWGANRLGQLGNGVAVPLVDPGPAPSTTAVDVVGVTGTERLSASADHTCATFRDGTAACWGIGGSGQLSIEPTAGSGTPVPVAAGGPVDWVSAGWRHTCGIRAYGQVVCWGNNTGGELGDGTAVGRSTPDRFVG